MHQALFYASNEEFLSATVPFIRRGLVQSEPVFVVTNSANIALLSDALGDAAEGVSFEDNARWYDFPRRALNAVCCRYRENRKAEGIRVHVIGEPVWFGRSDVETREWKRYESLVNVAYARFPILALCPYDTRVLPDTVLADACRTHPELLNGFKSGPNPQFVDPRAFVCQLDQHELPEPVPPPRQLVFDGDLGSLRRFVVEEASRAGMAARRLEELEWAANELATNVLRYADGRAVVRAWEEPEEFICEISDRGPGLDDPLVGHLPPSPDQDSPSGLWLAHQLCDLVEVRSSTSGLTARLHVSNHSSRTG